MQNKNGVISFRFYFADKSALLDIINYKSDNFIYSFDN